MKVNGIAHIQLTVNNLKECIPFYEKLLKRTRMASGWKSATCPARATWTPR